MQQLRVVGTFSFLKKKIIIFNIWIYAPRKCRITHIHLFRWMEVTNLNISTNAPWHKCANTPDRDIHRMHVASYCVPCPGISVANLVFKVETPRRAYTHVMLWNRIISPGNDNSWIARRMNILSHIYRARTSTAAVAACVTALCRCWSRASSVGQNGVNRPRVFKVIFARGGPSRAAGPRYPCLCAFFFRTSARFTFAHLHVDIHGFCAASYLNYEDGMPAGGNSRIRDYYPARMSERQQLALLLQMTSQEMVSGEGEGKKTRGSSERFGQMRDRQTRWEAWANLWWRMP